MGAKPTNEHWISLATPIHVPLVAATTGEIVAAVPGKRIVVVALHVRADVAGTIQFTATGDLTGDMMIALGEGIHASDYVSGLFETENGVALSATMTTMTADGWLTYVEIDGE